jgi:hypothetical protein
VQQKEKKKCLLYCIKEILEHKKGEKKMTEKEKQKYENIFLKVWDNSLLEKDLLMDMCELLTQEKIKALENGITLFYYKTTNGRTFVIEDDEISGTLEIYEEKK